MKQLVIGCAAALSLGSSGVIAQEMEPAEPGTAQSGQAPAEEAQAEPEVEVPESVKEAQDSAELRGAWILDTTVQSPEGETIGPVQDILIDQEQGSVRGAVLGVGGFLGLGAKSIAVDWNEFEINYDANEIVVPMTREQAEAAPEYQFRSQTPPPAPPAADTGTDMGTGSDTGMGTGM